MPGLGGRGAAGAGATSAGLEAAAALDFGAAALRGVGFAFLAADFFGALFLAAECCRTSDPTPNGRSIGLTRTTFPTCRAHYPGGSARADHVGGTLLTARATGHCHLPKLKISTEALRHAACSRSLDNGIPVSQTRSCRL